MKVKLISFLLLIFTFSTDAAEQSSTASNSAREGERELGMSIIGSQDLPKVLYIIPWKSPEPKNEMPFVSRVIDEVYEPIVPEVFERKVDFHRQIHDKTSGKNK